MTSPGMAEPPNTHTRSVDTSYCSQCSTCSIAEYIVGTPSKVGELEGSHLDLRTALAADLAAARIDVALQPIRRGDGQLFGYEALARWNYQATPVPPSTFLPIAAALGSAATLD